MDLRQWCYLCESNAEHVRIAAVAGAIAAVLVNGVLDDLQGPSVRSKNEMKRRHRTGREVNARETW